MKLNAKQLREGLGYRVQAFGSEAQARRGTGKRNEIYIVLDNVLDT